MWVFVLKHSNNEGFTALFHWVYSLCYRALLAYFNLITGFLRQKEKGIESISTFYCWGQLNGVGNHCVDALLCYLSLS